MKDEKESLKKEVYNLLTGEKQSIPLEKKIIFDEKANQFVIKIPKVMGDSIGLKAGSGINIVVNPKEKDFQDSVQSHFIIYGKEKETHT